MVDNNYVLAMYDIRSKQAFIYRSTALKEIVGGSLIIRDCFEDYLYPAANGVSDKGLFHKRDVDFTREGFKSHIEEGYAGELVYDGGGNFIVIYKDMDTYRDINYLFSKKILEKIGTLQILPTYIEGIDFDDYKGDRDKLYAKHKIEEGKQSFISPWGSLPIVQVDYATSEPIVEIRHENKSDLKVSQEGKAKRDKYDKVVKSGETEFDEKILDNMVYEKGTESLLAVIYADGNNMGAAVKKCIEDYKSYEDCVKAMRAFSDEIQKKFIDDRKKDIEEYLNKNYPDKNKRRFIVLSGDEITFICNARHAYEVMREYLRELPKGCSACAGAAIFHSHAPYSEAYRIAEECCEAGKKYMKDKDITSDKSFMDFYYCQGAIGVSLEAMREEVGDLNSKPWFVSKETDKDQDIAPAGCFSVEDVDVCKNILNSLGRSNVKGLADAAERGAVPFKMELKRIKAHYKEDDNEVKLKETDWAFLMKDKNRALVYDMVIFFDIWFDMNRYKKEEKEAGEQK